MSGNPVEKWEQFTRNLRFDLECRLAHSPKEPYLTLILMYDSEESKDLARQVGREIELRIKNQVQVQEQAKKDAADEWKMKAWIKKPPTGPQIGKLRALGIRTVPQNMWDASQLIDKAMKRKAA